MAEPDREDIEQERSNAELFVMVGNSQYPGMSYEEGVAAALAWVLGDSIERPLEGG